MTETQERNCAFQYAKIHGEIFRKTEIVCDKTSLTLDEAKMLWNKYYPDAARYIKNGAGAVEMVIWIDMDTPTSYGKYLSYISTDAESNGQDIWQTKKEYFPRQYKTTQLTEKPIMNDKHTNH